MIPQWRILRIHTMSHVPHLCDESFGGNLSGVAIAYKLWGLEQLCAMKERKFKKGLQRRIELITNILNIKGGHYDYKDITPKFRRNKPENNLELTQINAALRTAFHGVKAADAAMGGKRP